MHCVESRRPAEDFGMFFLRSGKTKLICALILLLCALCGFLPSASADAEMRRVVVGADLTEEQISSVYEFFDIRRGDVPELSLTSAEEQAALQGFVDQAIIGTKAISCVYLSLLPQGSGLVVEEQNINWYTPEMYIGSLSTAGLTDARIMVAAPFPVSGTAALAGIYKAYEDMTGETLDFAAKQAGTQELTVAGDLAGELGDEKSSAIIDELKQMLDETSGMTDDEIRRTVREIAARHDIPLTDTQVEQLLDLSRTLEKLNPERLSQTAEDVQSTLQKVTDAKDKVVSFAQTLKNFFESVKSFFDSLSSLFGKE